MMAIYGLLKLKHHFGSLMAVILIAGTLFLGMTMKTELSLQFSSQQVFAQDVEICSDGIDNNNDGNVDEEPCQLESSTAEICRDGIDNNNDGNVDEEPCLQMNGFM